MRNPASSADPPGEDYSLFGGALALRQPARGPRTSLDAVLLADFLPPGGPVAELGLGHGACALAALHLERAPKAWGIELQPDLAELAHFNARRNGLELSVTTGDLREPERLPPPGVYDRVLANPPYRAPGDGRISPEPSRDQARRETAGTLSDFLDAARRILNPGGALYLIFTARRTAELLHELRRRSLEPKRLRPIHGRREAPARLVLVEARRDGGVELTLEPPLHTHEDKDYSPELAAILAGRPGGPVGR